MNLSKIKTFKSIIILNEMISNKRLFKTIFNGEDKLLEPLFVDLLSRGYLTIQGDTYVTTDLGNKSFDLFMKRYEEYLKVFDIYSFVDLERGEFAFSNYFLFDTDDQWNAFKSDQRFDDVRIAVALYKKLDPHEIVFMSFINENRFDTKSTGWQIDILSDEIWNEIDQIVATAITPEQLGDESVILDIINQGTAIMIDLIKKEEENNKNKLANAQQYDNYETYETYEVIEDIDYYDSYYDPLFVPIFWIGPIFIW